MTIEQTVAQHYTHGSLEAALLDGLRRSGKNADRIDPDDLAPADEFHIGGRQATTEFADQLGLRPGMELLDIGSGIGGPARYFAHHRQCRVTGIDLTDEYVRVAGALSERAGLAGSVRFVQGSALALPFPPASFDGAYMLHVGMNIEDKEKLAMEVARVLRSGSLLGIYDVMRTGPGDLAYPVPWATTADLNAVAEPERYKKALQKAGLTVIAERNRRDFALAFFADLRAKAAAGGPPPLGLHVLMGKSTPAKVQNMIDNISKGRIAPVEIVGRKL